MLLTAPIRKKEGFYTHVGLLEAKLFGGHRENAYSCSGGELSLHFGYLQAISLIKINVQFYELTPTTENNGY